MTPENALSQLRDIHLPLIERGIGVLPTWVLPCLSVVAVIAIWVWRKQRRAMRWQRQAQAELDEVLDAIKQGEVQHGWQRISIVLRQLLILYHDEDSAAACTGEQWLAELDQLFETDTFTGPDGQHLLRSPYEMPSVKCGEQTAPALVRLVALVRGKLPTLGSSGSS